jgi:tRNA-Thr(GGU) m(6)t(6)A37 methyltransferase TsaA
MKIIKMKPIGIIHSPYKAPSDVPIQSIFNENVEGTIELYQPYEKGLKDLEGFSHAYVLFYFHQSNKEHLQASPYLEDNIHGIFSIRSPHRPNHIGLSIIKIKSIENNIIYFKGVDMIEATPVLDIKPYVSNFDCRKNTKNGWLEKHIKNGKIPNINKIHSN